MHPLKLYNLPLRFRAYEKHIASTTMMPIGQENLPVPVIRLNEGSWQTKEKVSSTLRIGFPGVASPTECGHDYFRASDTCRNLEVPYPELYLRERGSYVLNQLLGLDIVPQTDIVDLTRQGDDSIKVLGSIQRGIKGQTLETVSAKKITQTLADHPERLMEFYLYTMISGDRDKHNGNVVLEDGTNHLYSIDNELSASPNWSWMEFPEALKFRLREMDISPNYLEKLRHFTAPENRTAHTTALLPYYKDYDIEKMFRRAEIILQGAKILPFEEMCIKLKKLAMLML